MDLPEPVKARYSNVVKVCYQIRANYDKLSSSSQIFVSQMDEKLQALLFGYVRLLQSAHHQQQYMHSSNPALILREVRQIESEAIVDHAEREDLADDANPSQTHDGLHAQLAVAGIEAGMNALAEFFLHRSTASVLRV